MAKDDKFDFAELLEDSASVMVKKKTFNALVQSEVYYRARAFELEFALREVSRYIEAGSRVDKHLCDTIEAALKT